MTPDPDRYFVGKHTVFMMTPEFREALRPYRRPLWRRWLAALWRWLIS